MINKIIFKNKQGIALPVVVLLIALVSILGFSAVSLVMHQGEVIGQEIDQLEALHYAEAGIHEYLGHANKITNIPWDKWGEVIPFGDGFYMLNIDDGDQHKLERVITSTGWVKGDEKNKAIIEVLIGRAAFNQYSYFSGTDKNIVWTDKEKCFGPYHTNDTLNISGWPVFYGPVTYVNSISGISGYWQTTLENIFREGRYKISPIIVPETNYQLKERALEQGHYYNGRTRILLKGKQYEVKYFDENGREISTPQRKDLPKNGVIYVDGTSSSNYNKFSKEAGNLFISGELAGELTIGAANNIYITGFDPTEDEFKIKKTSIWTGTSWEENAKPTPSRSTQGIVYQRTRFKERKENGETVGFIRDETSDDDLLGLVANNDIVILGSGWFNNSRGSIYDGTNNVAPRNITIHGAIFAINGGFTYESYEDYNKNEIVLRGSLIQKERKPVGLVGSRGYIKNYAHDPKMLYYSPPNFPEPLNTGWEIKKWSVLRQ